jgi:type IV pilus assembly protein PilA
MSRKQKSQAGFTIIEVMLVTLILGVLGSVAIASARDYMRRASLSEVVLAVSRCKNAVSEGYSLLDSAPDPGRWGCESGGATGKYSGPMQTDSNGAIRIRVDNLDNRFNGRYIYLVPARNDGRTVLTPADLGQGQGVRSWICGSDWLLIRNALPANCRVDTRTFIESEEGFAN